MCIDESAVAFKHHGQLLLRVLMYPHHPPHECAGDKLRQKFDGQERFILENSNHFRGMRLVPKSPQELIEDWQNIRNDVR